MYFLLHITFNSVAVKGNKLKTTRGVSRRMETFILIEHCFQDDFYALINQKHIILKIFAVIIQKKNISYVIETYKVPLKK